MAKKKTAKKTNSNATSKKAAANNVVKKKKAAKKPIAEKSAVGKKAVKKNKSEKKVVVKKKPENGRRTKSNYPTSTASDTAITRVRATGATHLRTVWDGWGDGGCFNHNLYFSPKSTPENCDDDELNKEVERLLLRNGLADEYGGTSCGTVGILALNLRTGSAVWTCGEGDRVGRCAEILLMCKMERVDSLKGTLTIKRELVDHDEEMGDIWCSYGAVGKLSAHPGPDRHSLTALSETIGRAFASMDDGLCADEGLLDQLWMSCGTTVKMTVDVATRTFVFTGKRKKVSVKVPKRVLKVTRFTVDLDAPAAKEKNSANGRRGK
jgi:hypothetical protein